MSRRNLKNSVCKMYRNCVKECRLRALVATQKELATMTGINPVSISLYERQKMFPSVYSAILIAQALGCQLDDLFEKKLSGIEGSHH